MASRYHCVHCDNRFELDADEERPRCPQCMRRNGVELVEQAATAPKPKGSRALLAALALALVAIAGGIWWSVGPPRLEEVVPTRPLSAKEFRAYLERDGVAGARWASLFTLSDAPDDGADALLALTKSKGARWPLDAPLERAVRNADEVAAALGEEKQRYYSLELAVWLAAALRDQGEDALLVEVWQFNGDTRPPDPSGLFGYFGVAVEPKEGAPVFDPSRGVSRTPAANSWRAMTDTQVVAAAMGTEAMRALFDSGDGAAALKLAEKALALDPKSPSLRAVHASVLLESQALDDAVKELQAAHELRSDGPRKVSLVQLYTAQAGLLQMAGEIDAAEKQWGLASQIASQTEQTYPDFSRAHLAMASIYMGQGDIERAKVSLERAEQLEPDAIVLPTAWSQYFFQVGEIEQAVAAIETAVDRRPKNWRLHLQAAQAQRAASNYDKMREHARAAVELVAPEKRADLRKEILQGLSSTALDEPGSVDDLEEEDDEELSEIDLSTALPDPGAAIGAAAGGPIDESDTPKLRLRDPGDSLQLDLSD